MSVAVAEDLYTRLPRRALVTGNRKLTATGTILISFKVADGEPFQFEPGEYVAVDCMDSILGYCRSPYCIFSKPAADGCFEFLVRVVPDGPVSLYLEKLQVGDMIGFRGPLGKSMLVQEPGEETILIATGVGISPFNSLLQEILPKGHRDPVTLYWGLRQFEDICCLDELEDLALNYPNFQYFISLSQAEDKWKGLSGRLTESLPPLLETLDKKHFYLCGNGAMIAEFSAALAEIGVPRMMIFEESFFNHKHKVSPERIAELCRCFVARDLVSPLAILKEITK